MDPQPEFTLFRCGGTTSFCWKRAYHFGADSDVDAQGRVLVPTELRRKLAFEGEQVFLRCFKQRIEVIGREVYEQRFTKAMEGLDGKVQGLEKKGLR